ncbi:diphosphomevalonate decarboxylase [Nonlabens sp. Hel1_33_55]|uniref:diphosphomevalonate/mevalonate 3,5-bisphosphate decarboxylase family protein n=1 Tax=Nonlabens sp. Hel1_33_55 TaxID=1336802 RepID=UPI000875C10A|nr:diphosphomevalonate decarboxylase [Nonlabens sp. Hel1_33_55]SCY44144.1 diphosphomevalonate decarboxylase [Nonlabens sp. Hel1_33_55]
MEDQFKLTETPQLKPKLTASWQAPSNIALVKYWGKHGTQLPANPSISFTLNDCRTITTLTATQSDHHSFEVLLDGKPKPSFAPKIESYFKRIENYSPWIKSYKFKIETTNTFPHSSGIASSASSMAAMSSCIVAMESELTGTKIDKKKASFLARLGSGSACRSLEGKLVVWGEHADTAGSSDLYGVDVSVNLHPIFQDFQDTILLVDKGEKTVSSTLGHELMNGHAFAKARFLQAHSNLTEIKKYLASGDLDGFIKITESEALTLHSMMMTSHPYFMLMKPNTLSIIEEIWKFRNVTKTPVCFTLDAGANVHMLYPAADKEAVEELIKSKLAQYCQNEHYICDHIGNGASAV